MRTSAKGERREKKLYGRAYYTKYILMFVSCTHDYHKHSNHVMTDIILLWINCNMCIVEWPFVIERIHIYYNAWAFIFKCILLLI